MYLNMSSNSHNVFTLEDDIEPDLPMHIPLLSFPATDMMVQVETANISDIYAAGPGNGELHCTHGALVGPLGLFVQALLAFIAFTSLIVKRFCEPRHERRPWIVWFFDTSKQAIGAGVMHFANVFLAHMFTGDPCTWYIISFLLDSTAGLVVIYIGLKISQCVAVHKKYNTLLLGEYGHPPQCKPWMGQCAIYIFVILIEKILMTLLVMFDFWKEVRKFIMYPIKDPNVELILVMFVVPFFVNALIFWVVDNFLKKSLHHKPSHGPISNNESASKYFRAVQKVRYHKQTSGGAESESDALLSLDDEPNDAPANQMISVNGPLIDSIEEACLLNATVT